MSEPETQASQGTQTILFTDLEGSTDLRVRLGDSLANDVFREHDRLVRAQIEAGGGTDVKALGDGYMALFSSAGLAIETAVTIQRMIEEANRANPERAVSVRMGLNSGDVTHSQGEAHGTAVHAASRVAAKAQGGQILISQIVSDLAGSLGKRNVVDRGLFWLKGFPDRWRLYEVLWREKEASEERVTRDIREASAAAFDPSSPRSEGPVVGRKKEQEVITEQLKAAPISGLRAVVLEGEAGIGKTRMLEATADLARTIDTPYWVLDVAADEELRGPFLLFRSLLSSPRMTAVAREAMALETLDRAQAAISGQSTGTDQGLSPQEQRLRIFDEVSSAVLALAREQPVALLTDDAQWADEDSLQLIRYLVRTLPTAPICLLITIRPYSETSSVAGKLIADLDRMRVTRVIRLQRFGRDETAQLLQNVLGAPVDEQTLLSLHARSEGVPFFIEEFVRAYREADALQLMDGTWTMTRLSGPAVPASVQSLIERRLAQLSDECRSLLADAGVLGRRFRLADLAPVLSQIRREEEKPEWELAEALDTAVDGGLLVEEPEGSKYDFSFSHDQIRESLLDSIPRRRKQAIHGAIAEVLALREGTPDLSMLAHHAMRAGDSKKAVSCAIAAAKEALSVSAPEEGIRLIDGTLPAASEPEDRIEMLRIKDDALNLLDRGMDRIANLAEMSALTGAVTSPELETEVGLRRASAARSIEDYETAIELATSVRGKAVEMGDADLQMRACFELGQAHTRAPIGEGYWPVTESDLDSADEAYTRALELARQTESRHDEAIALRELAVIEAGRVREFALAAVQSGTSKFEILQMGPQLFAGAKELAQQAFRIFEEIDDQRGAMSALISMAYSHITDPTAHGMAGRIEHIRALHNSREGKITDSQRARENALMLYSVHTYARLNLQPDLALERGQEAFEAARVIGDRWLEALSAGGVAMTYASYGDADSSTAWLSRAATAAMSTPSNSMARRLEMWRGSCAAAAAQADDARDHYQRAAELGAKHPAARVEALCALAIDTAKVWASNGDAALLQRARAAANETLDASKTLPEDCPWASVAHGVLALVAQAEGSAEDAADEARTAISTLDGLTHILHYIDVLWAAGRVLIGQQAAEAKELAQQIAQVLGYLSMNMVDPEIKARWFGVDAHRELAALAGFELGDGFGGGAGAIELADREMAVLRELTSGNSDGNATKDEISELLSTLGVGTETEAIEYAIKAGVTWQ